MVCCVVGSFNVYVHEYVCVCVQEGKKAINYVCPSRGYYMQILPLFVQLISETQNWLLVLP